MRSFLFLISLVLLNWTACKTVQNNTTNQSDGPIDFNIIASGQYSGVEEQGVMLISDKESWAASWEMVNKIFMPAPELPEVNFKKEMVVACFMGMRSNGGYTMSLDKLEQDGHDLKAHITHQVPGPGCITTSVIVNPYAFAKIDKHELRSVDPQITKKTNDCDSDR